MASDQKNIKSADDFIINFMVEQMVNMTEEIHNMKEGCKDSFEHLANGMQDNFDRLSREIKRELINNPHLLQLKHNDHNHNLPHHQQQHHQQQHHPQQHHHQTQVQDGQQMKRKRRPLIFPSQGSFMLEIQ